LFVLAPLVACTASGSDAPIAVTHDACAPPTVTAGPAATAIQLDGIAAAEALWRARGAPALGVRPGGVLEVQFQAAAPPFHGLYDDQASVIYINNDLADPGELAIVIAHELGHSFGLVHVSPDVRLSLMNPGNLDVLPTEDDQRALEALWGVCQ
jgi:hypothetical protein